MAPQVKRFEETHAAANLESRCLSEFASTVIIKQQCVGSKLFAQKNCAEFSDTQCILLLGH